MQKLILFFAFLFVFSACKKDDDPTPADPITTVSGTYDVSRLQVGADAYNLPLSSGGQTVSATLTAAKGSADNTVLLSITLRVSGSPDDTSDIGEVEVRGTGNNLELYDGTTKVGTADGTTLNIDATDGTDRLVIVARKQ